MAKLGCLLIILAIVGLFLIVVIPVLPFAEDDQTINDILTPLICQPGETIQRNLYSSYHAGETSYSMTVDCLDNEGQTYDATGRWVLIGMGAFLVPFLIGLFSLIAGIQRKVSSIPAISLNQDTFTVIGTSRTTPAPSSNPPTLTERLKEIQNARQEGLISAEEYERMRQQILDQVGHESE